MDRFFIPCDFFPLVLNYLTLASERRGQANVSLPDVTLLCFACVSGVCPESPAFRSSVAVEVSSKGESCELIIFSWFEPCTSSSESWALLGNLDEPDVWTVSFSDWASSLMGETFLCRALFVGWDWLGTRWLDCESSLLDEFLGNAVLLRGIRVPGGRAPSCWARMSLTVPMTIDGRLVWGCGSFWVPASARVDTLGLVPSSGMMKLVAVGRRSL